MIKEVVTRNKRPFLILDAGNSLFKIKNGTTVLPQEKITAEGIMLIYEEMGYSAVNVGSHDIKAGLSLLTQKKSFPWISSNFYSQTGASLFSPFITKNIDGLQVGIIGITGVPLNLQNDIIFRNWHDVLPNIINKVNSRCDFIILLSSLPQDENIKIANQFPTIRLIISASLTRSNVSPQKVNNAIVTQTEKRGKYLGTLTVSSAISATWGKDSQNDITYQKKKLATLEWKISQLKNSTKKPKNTSQKINRLQVQKKSIEDLIEKLEAKSSTMKEADISPSTYTSNFVALTSSIPEDEDIAREVRAIKNSISEFNTSKKKKTYDKQFVEKYTTGLAGYLKCSECHQKQTDFWKTTSHSHSFQTLERNKESRNLDCLICHVTQKAEHFQMTQKDSSFLLSLTDELKAVGCESCHGAGLSHVKNPSYSKMDRKITSKVCQNCHTTERDDRFLFDAKKEKVACPED